MVPQMKHPRFAEAFAAFNELAAALAKVQTRIAELSVLLSGSQDLSVERESGHVAAATAFSFGLVFVCGWRWAWGLMLMWVPVSVSV